MDDRLGKILDAFFKGDLVIDPGRNPRQKELGQKMAGLHEELRKRLDGADKELLESLVDTIMDDGACYGEKMLMRGYQLGMMMAAEAFLGQDSFLTGEE